MTQISRTVLVPYSAKDLYELVLDVNAYPEFLPWCGGASVSEQTETLQVATVKIAKGPVKAEFTTRNTLLANESIDVTLVKGPFSNLDGSWRFKALSDNACKVELDMQFDFAAGPVGMLLKPVFTAICGSLLNAFTERARAILPAA